MFDFYERRKLKQYAYSWPTLIVLLVAMVFLTNGVWSVYQKERETKERLDQRVVHLNELETRGEALVSEIDRLSSERGLEAELRGKFEVAKEGERMIVIVDAPRAEAQVETGRKGFAESFLDLMLFWR